jgi:hypothetical protein
MLKVFKHFPVKKCNQLISKTISKTISRSLFDYKDPFYLEKQLSKISFQFYA